MRRRLFAILAVLSLAMAMVVGALVVLSYTSARSYAVAEGGTFHHFGIGDGRIWCSSMDEWRGDVQLQEVPRDARLAFSSAGSFASGWSLVFVEGWSGQAQYSGWNENVWTGNTARDAPFRNAVVSLWSLLTLTMVIPLAWVAWLLPWSKLRPRDRTGLCPSCGYDLRATPERCPECGRVAEAKAAEARG